MFYHCESEAGSSCSTPFVSAPSSPSRSGTTSALKTTTAKNTGTTSKNSLYYYFSAPSSPPRDHKLHAAANPEHHHQRGFSFTECEFQFHSRFDGGGGGGGGGGSGGGVVAALPSVLVGERRREEEEEEEEAMMEDAEMGGVAGFYFSAPTSPDRRNKDRSGKGGGIWDEMPGTPKMIFGANAAASRDPSPALGFFNADSDFEFSSSRMSDSDSTISAQMSSADELFFKGQLLPMKIPPPQLTSSDSSGSSNTIASTDSSDHCSSSSAAAPPSPRSARKAGGSASPGRMKSAIPRPARTSSKGRTLRELLHLSSMHKKNKPGPSSSKAEEGKKTIQGAESTAKESKEAKDSTPPPPPPSLPVPPSKPLGKKLDSSALTKRLVEKSLVGDHSKRFTAASAARKTPSSSSASGNLQGIAIHKKRLHSLDLQHSGGSTGGYYSSARRLHSGSIVPEAEFPAMAARPHKGRLPDATIKNKRLNYHVAHRRGGQGGGRGGSMFHSGPIVGGKLGGGGMDFQSARFTDLNLHSKGGGDHFYYSNSAASSACSSRNVSPRRSRNNSINSSSSGNILGGATNVSSSSSAAAAAAAQGGGGISLHELHYKSQQRVNSEEMRRKTFLPYKQGLLGCLGCATMRIAGLSKSLQPMASSR
ncbi:hypothetical protein SELMODRAFT_406011 [Selaginella moellendorffii]|uniref:Uncharacterized protein n=1 Tax=Selaginella moellendorffii TaxID=88036 RepID=D8R0D4_SELML|nr:hypothetical protein SELMODRAFT_406011 [Selaginella moellendorffii]